MDGRDLSKECRMDGMKKRNVSLASLYGMFFCTGFFSSFWVLGFLGMGFSGFGGILFDGFWLTRMIPLRNVSVFASANCLLVLRKLCSGS